MIETLYFMIVGLEIFLKPGYPDYKYEQVPLHAVHHCMDDTMINPYIKMTRDEEIVMADCLMHKMSHYE